MNKYHVKYVYYLQNIVFVFPCDRASMIYEHWGKLYVLV